MASGQKALTAILYGAEDPHGTLAAATGYVLGEHQPITADHQTAKIRDDMKVRADATRTMVYAKLVTDTLRIPHGYFQILPMLGSICLEGAVVPSEQTVGQLDYLWTFDPSMTAENEPDSIALWLEDNVDVSLRHYVMGKRLRFSFQVPQGQGDANLQAELEYFAQKNDTGVAQAGISKPTVETINAKLMRIYLDATWAALGTTEKAGILRAGTVEILTGLHPIMNGSAYTYFTDHEEGMIGVTAALTFERNATSQAIIAAAKSSAGGPKTPAALRLEVEGSQIGTGENHSLKLDIWGYWDQYVGNAQEADGTLLDTVTFAGIYDPTSAKMFQMLVSTNVSTI